MLVHKKSFTFIKELMVEEFFGEYAFFSDYPRKATAKSKNYLEVCVINKIAFLAKIESFPQCHQTLEIIQHEVNNNQDLTLLGIVCYVCQNIGHLSVDCDFFNKIKGNHFNLFKRGKELAHKLWGKVRLQKSKSQKWIKKKAKKLSTSARTRRASFKRSHSSNEILL